MADAVITDLAEEVLSLSRSETHRQRRRLWAELHALRPRHALVSFGMHQRVWEQEIFPPENFQHQAGLPRRIEAQLRFRLWKAAHIPDDEPVLPTVWLFTPHPAGAAREIAETD